MMRNLHILRKIYTEIMRNYWCAMCKIDTEIIWTYLYGIQNLSIRNF